MMALNTPITISGHASSFADDVQQRINESNSSLQESYTFGSGREIFRKFRDVLMECSSTGWDGEDAKPISHDVFISALIFLKCILSAAIEPPEISAEPDGAITFEWYRNPRRVLSVSINPDDRVYYAALLGTSRRHGVDPIQRGISQEILELIYQVIQE